MIGGILRRLGRNESGAAAVEMALVTPLLLILMVGGLEIGNYFMDEHRLVKAVRDGARYAARKDFSYFQTCNAAPVDTVAPIENVVTDTQNLVRTSYLSGGTDQLANLEGAVTVTTKCSAGSGSVVYEGIYKGMTGGARYVEVSATADYLPVLAPFGFSLLGAKLNAKQQAAVSGV